MIGGKGAFVSVPLTWWQKQHHHSVRLSLYKGTDFVGEENHFGLIWYFEFFGFIFFYVLFFPLFFCIFSSSPGLYFPPNPCLVIPVFLFLQAKASLSLAAVFISASCPFETFVCPEIVLSIHLLQSNLPLFCLTSFLFPSKPKQYLKCTDEPSCGSVAGGRPAETPY